MFNSISEKITGLLIRQGTIADSQKELYRYGFNQGFTMVFNVITTLIIGCVFGMVIQSIVFLMAYIPLRSYAGGYHASTPWRCYFISLILMIVVLAIIKLMSFSVIGSGVILGIGTIICVALAPVEDKNKPLDEAEQKVYKRRTYIILFAEICISILICLAMKEMFSVICFSVFTESIMLIFGKIKNAFNKALI